MGVEAEPLIDERERLKTDIKTAVSQQKRAREELRDMRKRKKEIEEALIDKMKRDNNQLKGPRTSVLLGIVKKRKKPAISSKTIVQALTSFFETNELEAGFLSLNPGEQALAIADGANTSMPEAETFSIKTIK